VSGRFHLFACLSGEFRRGYFLNVRQRLDRLACAPYAFSVSNAKKKHKAMMLGVGLDSDGHKRITTGENFALVGGTEETHELMTEKTIKINEKLKSRGKQLEEISHKEFDDIAQEAGLKKFEPPRRK
jgi:seryl-tRNA(Sec) selenium transferase